MSQQTHNVTHRFTLDDSNYVQGQKNVTRATAVATTAQKMQTQAITAYATRVAMATPVVSTGMGIMTAATTALTGAKAALTGASISATAALFALGGALVVVGGALTVASGAAGFLVGTLVSMQPVLMSLIQGFITLQGMKIAKPFLDEAAAADDARRTFAALLGGDMEGGRQMFAAVEQYARSSVFPIEALTEMVRELSMGGHDVNRLLPIFENMALMRGPDPANMQKMAMVMQRINAGDISMAMGPRGLGQFGISRDMLQSIRPDLFDDRGSFQGTKQEFIDLLDVLGQTDERLKRISESFQDTTAGGLKQFREGIGQLKQVLGEAIWAEFGSSIKEASDAFHALSRTNAFARLVAAAKTLTGIGGDSATDGILKMTAALQTSLEVLQMMKMMAIAFGQQLDVLLDKLKWFGIIGWGANKGFEMGSEMGDLAVRGYEWNLRQLQREFAEAEKDSSRDNKADFPDGFPWPPGYEETPNILTESNRHLANIERNTRDMRDIIIGGGDLGRFGLTGPDRARIREGYRPISDTTPVDDVQRLLDSMRGRSFKLGAVT